MPRKGLFKLLGTFPIPAGLFNKGSAFMRVFAFIYKDSLRQGYSMATNKEIAFEVGLKPLYVSYVLNSLKRGGYIQINRHPYNANVRIIRIVPHVFYRMLLELKMLLINNQELIRNADIQREKST